MTASDDLEALADVVRAVFAASDERHRQLLIRTLDEAGMELGGVNVPDLPREGDPT